MTQPPAWVDADRPVSQTPGVDTTALLERLADGKLVEGPEYASEDYVKGLARTLIVSGDTELISAPAYLKAAEHAPRLQSFVSVIGIIQDELGHAHIAYRMLRDLGVDTDALIYEREPSDFRYPYAFDVPLENWSEMVVANGFYDRAGFVLLSDIFQHTSYGPWKRALVKVDREETFHLRHGERWMKTLAARRRDARRAPVGGRLDVPDDARVVRAAGPPQAAPGADRLRPEGQDERRAEAGVDVDRRAVLRVDRDRRSGSLRLRADASTSSTAPSRSSSTSDEKRWLTEEGEITWDEVLERWRRRGPANEELVEMIQRGRLQRVAAAA